MAAYIPARSTSSSCRPCSTIRPESNTKIRSACCTLASRWAITMVVRPVDAAAIACFTSLSVVASSCDVASSSSKISGSRMSARAIAKRWRWPPDNFDPWAPTSVLYPSGRLMMNSCSSHFFATVMISASLASVPGRLPRPILNLTVPGNRSGSCSTKARRER